MFLQASVILFTGGDCLVPGGCLVRGVCSLAGCLVRGVPGPGGSWWRTPPGRLLLRAVRILLKCILFFKCYFSHTNVLIKHLHM